MQKQPVAFTPVLILMLTRINHASEAAGQCRQSNYPVLLLRIEGRFGNAE